jgi:hypothetical protein
MAPGGNPDAHTWIVYDGVLACSDCGLVDSPVDEVEVDNEPDEGAWPILVCAEA